MPKIITVTANTAIDYILTIQHLTWGENLIAERTLKFAAGKGINVAKAAAALGQSVKVLGFVGQQSWDIFQQLQSNLITVTYTKVEGETRTNITLRDPSQQHETHIRGQGFTVTTRDCQHLIHTVVACLKPYDIVILSGSVPKGTPSDFYPSLIEHCHACAAQVFLDSSGDSLQHGLYANPDLIKPNHTEFEVLIGKSLPDEKALIDAAQNLIAGGVKNVLISRAAKGALLINKHAVLSASMPCEQSAIVSHVGCGDAMLAGFAVATLQNKSLEERLTWSVAAGAANLFSAEAGHFSIEHFFQNLTKVVIKNCSIQN
jgi:1-phosphofructokinase